MEKALCARGKFHCCTGAFNDAWKKHFGNSRCWQRILLEGLYFNWGHNGKVFPVTVINVADLFVTQVKTTQNEGYSALQLGKFAIENGNADSYIGYAANFMIITEESRTTTPHKDKNFKPFMEVYVTLIFSLVSGLTTGESVKKTKNHIRNLIKDYGILGIRDKYGDAPLIRFGLYWDLFYLKVLGKENSVI